MDTAYFDHDQPISHKIFGTVFLFELFGRKFNIATPGCHSYGFYIEIKQSAEEYESMTGSMGVDLIDPDLDAEG